MNNDRCSCNEDICNHFLSCELFLCVHPDYSNSLIWFCIHHTYTHSQDKLRACDLLNPAYLRKLSHIYHTQKPENPAPTTFASVCSFWLCNVRLFIVWDLNSHLLQLREESLVWLFICCLRLYLDELVNSHLLHTFCFGYVLVFPSSLFGVFQLSIRSSEVELILTSKLFS